jgi:hypothetical protein
MNTTIIKNLKSAHKTNWLAFTAKVEKVLTVIGERMSAEATAEKGRTVTVTWSTITDHVTAADFVAAGFSADEAEAMIFVLTQDCMGQAVNSTEMVDRWFCYCAK